MTPNYSDEFLRGMVPGTRLIAMIGASANPALASNRVMRLPQRNAYRVVPVNAKDAAGRCRITRRDEPMSACRMAEIAGLNDFQ